jgi:dienelactone hydrolase
MVLDKGDRRLRALFVGLALAAAPPVFLAARHLGPLYVLGAAAIEGLALMNVFGGLAGIMGLFAAVLVPACSSSDEPPDGGGAGGCSPESLDDCEYPSRGVSYTERVGISVTEPVSGRELPLLARIPEGPGPFPTIVWSHGGGFNDTGHRQAEQWGDALASHGYAVIHIAHATLTTEAGLALCAACSVPANECAPGEDEDANGLVALFKTHDVVAVLDALPMLSDASVAAGGPAIDLERVAVAGWSAGARAPIVAHGAVFYPSMSAPVYSMVHSLPKAAVAMSPVGPDYGGFFDTGSDNTWQGMRGPVLMATGDNDLKTSKPDLTGEDRRVAFEKQPADGSRWLL